MKNIIQVLFFICFVAIGCSIPEDQIILDHNKTTSFFAGNHELYSLSSISYVEQKSNIRGSFFVAIGSLSGGSSTELKEVVKFAWKNSKNEYMLTKMPMEMVRFVIDSTISKPYCKFKWHGVDNDYFSETNWTANVIYVVLVLKEENIYRDPIKIRP